MDKYVACTTKKQWKAVLKKFEEDGYRWFAGNSVLSGIDYFNSYKSESVLHVHPDTKRLEFGEKDFYRKSGIKTFISAHDFLTGAKTKPIVISRNGRVVTAEDKNTGEKGVATCSPSDEFDFKVGAKIALARLWGEEVPKSLLNCEEEHTFEVGDRVVVRDWDDMQKKRGLDSDGDIIGGFVRKMKHLCGRTATVISCNDSGNIDVTFDDKSGDVIWYFSDWMFKPLVKEDAVTKFKVGDLVTLKEGFEINKTYGGIRLINGMYDMGYHKSMKVIEVDDSFYKCISAEKDPGAGHCYLWFSEEMLEKWNESKKSASKTVTDDNTYFTDEIKVGNRVKIRDWDDMEKEFGLDCWGYINSPLCFNARMKKYCGKVVVITHVNENDGSFNISDDKNWWFDKNMIVKTKTPEPKFNVGDFVRTRKDAVAGKKYENLTLLDSMITKCAEVVSVERRDYAPYVYVTKDGYTYTGSMLEKYEDDDEIRENDIVEVAWPLQCYDTYTAWIVKNIASVELAAKFVYHRIPKTDTQYRVIKIASHSGNSKLKLAYIQDKTRGDCFIMNLSALKKVKK